MTPKEALELVKVAMSMLEIIPDDIYAPFDSPVADAINSLDDAASAIRPLCADDD